MFILDLEKSILLFDFIGSWKCLKFFSTLVQPLRSIFNMQFTFIIVCTPFRTSHLSHAYYFFESFLITLSHGEKVRNNTVMKISWIWIVTIQIELNFIKKLFIVYWEIKFQTLIPRNPEPVKSATQFFFQPILNWFMFCNTDLNKFLKIEIFAFKISKRKQNKYFVLRKKYYPSHLIT